MYAALVARDPGLPWRVIIDPAFGRPGHVLYMSKLDEKQLARARTLFDQKKFSEAAAEARRARELDERNLAAWKLGGLALQLGRSYAESEHEFREALKRFAEDAELWFYLSRVQYLQHKLKPAEEAAREAIRKKEDFADAFTQLGMIREARQEHAGALVSYESAIDLNRRQSRPETMPLVQAAELLLRLGRLEESAGHWASAAAIVLSGESRAPVPPSEPVVADTNTESGVFTRNEAVLIPMVPWSWVTMSLARSAGVSRTTPQTSAMRLSSSLLPRLRSWRTTSADRSLAAIFLSATAWRRSRA